MIDILSSPFTLTCGQNSLDIFVSRDNLILFADGYYTVTLPSGLIVVALNTNLYYQSNKVFSDLTETDPGSQFTMLESLLQDARDNKTKVSVRFKTTKKQRKYYMICE